MVDQIAVVEFTTPAASDAAFDVTSPLITETFKAAILIFSRLNSDDADTTTAQLGYGFVAVDNDGTATSNIACHSHARNGITNNTDCFHNTLTTDCLVVANEADTVVDVSAVFVSAVAGGMRLNFTVGGGGTQVKCIALLFAGTSRAATGQCGTTSAGSHENVGPGGSLFEPDLVVFAPEDLGFNLRRADFDFRLGFAVNDAGVSQVCAYNNSDDAVTTTDADGIYHGDACWHAFESDRVGQKVQLTSFDSTGFNLDTPDAGSPQSAYLAIKWTDPARVRVAVANMAVAASTGLQSFNAFGFTPDVVFGMAHLLTSTGSLTDGATAAAGGYFMTGKFASRAWTARHREGIGPLSVSIPTEATTRTGPHAVLLYDHLGALVQQAAWAGPSGGGGFTLNFSTASQAGTLTALGIQIIPGAPPAPGQDRAVGLESHRRQHRPTIATRRTSSIIGNALREISRFRRAALARVRWRPPVEFKEPIVIGVETEEEAGRISGPGALRGAVATQSVLGRVASAGATRGTIVGPGVDSPELEP